MCRGSKRRVIAREPHEHAYVGDLVVQRPNKHPVEIKLYRGKTVKLPDGRKVSVAIHDPCGHLYFPELSRAVHFFPNVPLTLDDFVVQWRPAAGMECFDESERTRAILDTIPELFRTEFREAIWRNVCEDFQARDARFAEKCFAFKGFDADLKCLEFQYATGKTFRFKNPVMCKHGAHACLFPEDVFKHYARNTKKRYFRVLLEGAQHDQNKSVAEQITLQEEILERDFRVMTGVFESPTQIIWMFEGKTRAIYNCRTCEFGY